MDDLAIQRIGMGGRRLKDIAAVFSTMPTAIALTNRLAAENERKDERIAILESQIKELGVSDRVAVCRAPSRSERAVADLDQHSPACRSC
jgi:hypothetical protein